MNIRKSLIGAAVALSMVMPLAVGAATITDALFSNGDTTIDAQGNSSVSGTFTLQVGSSEVCEVLRTQAAPQAFTDTSVGGSLGLQFGTHTNVPFTVKVSPNTGTYNATVQCAGLYGANRSVDGNDYVVVGPQSLGTIRVVSNTSNNSNSSGDSTPSWFQQWVNSWNASHPTPSPTPAPTTSSQCAALTSKLVGTMDNVYNDANVRLQGYLLSEGASIPALKAGASFGFKGIQTRSAVSMFMSANNCN